MGLRIALPEGRLLKDSLDTLKRIGIEPPVRHGRKLVIQSGGVSFIFCKAFDVPLYVEHGIDLGIAGGDVVYERNCDLFVPLEMDFGRCRLSLISQQSKPLSMDEMDGYRIGTKYPRITKACFASKGLSVSILPFSGAVELGPVLGICDAIVDIVDSGRTIQENGLEEKEVLMQIGAMLLVNRIAQKKHFQRINEIVVKLNALRESERKDVD